MSESTVERIARIIHVEDPPEAATVIAAEIDRLTAECDEARRRRDEWRKKAEGYDSVRLALREKVGGPWPPTLSRMLWAGIAADQRRRADDAEAERDAARAEVERLREAVIAEREACAKIVEALGWDDFAEAETIAAAIRARAALQQKEESTQTETGAGLKGLIQRNQNEAYQGGWDDGYAEGRGKALADAIAAFPALNAYGRGVRARLRAALQPKEPSHD